MSGDIIIPADAYPTLTTCRANLTRKIGHGLCFHETVALVLDVPKSRMVIGAMRRVGFSMLHAWTETQGRVFSTSALGRFGVLVGVDRDGYYAENDVEQTATLSRRSVKTFAREVSFHRHIRGERLTLASPFAAELCERAGMPFRVNSSGGMVGA